VIITHRCSILRRTGRRRSRPFLHLNLSLQALQELNVLSQHIDLIEKLDVLLHVPHVILLVLLSLLRDLLLHVAYVSLEVLTLHSVFVLNVLLEGVDIRINPHKLIEQVYTALLQLFVVLQVLS
jgi:hypothetical protein